MNGSSDAKKRLMVVADVEGVWGFVTCESLKHFLKHQLVCAVDF